MEKIKLFFKPTIIKLVFTLLIFFIGAGGNAMLRDCRVGFTEKILCEKIKFLYFLWPFFDIRPDVELILNLAYCFLITSLVVFLIKLAFSKVNG